MSQINEDILNQRVSTLVTLNPSYASIFEDLGIDYCCKGKIPLHQACEENNLDAANVLKMLSACEAYKGKIDLSSLSLNELIENIELSHHAYLRKQLPRISQLLQKVIHAHGHKYPTLEEAYIVFSKMAQELQEHLQKEEDLVFPVIVTLEKGESLPSDKLEEFVAMLEEEHEETGECLRKLKELTNHFTPPSDACTTYRVMLQALDEMEKDIHSHVHKENYVLFPRALEMLKGSF